MMFQILYPAFFWMAVICFLGLFVGGMLISFEGDTTHKHVGIPIVISCIVIGITCLFLGCYGMRVNDYPTCPNICQKATVNQFYKVERKQNETP